MKFNFTLQHLCRFVITCCFLSTIGLSPSKLQAQCSLACTGTVQVSLDMYCEAEITPDMVLNDDATSCPDGVFEVVVQDQYGNDMTLPLSPDGFPIVDGSLIGYTAYVKVVDTESGNSCWGNLIVEDKLPPMIYCNEDDTPITVDFELLTADDLVTDQYEDVGVSFGGDATILTDGINLNSGPYPPSSGVDVLYSPVNGELPIEAVGYFWSSVSFNYSSNSPLTIEAYDIGGNLIESETGPAMLNASGEISIEADHIASVLIHDSGSFFIIDDLEVVPETNMNELYCYQLIDFKPLLSKPECNGVTFDMIFEDIVVNDCTDSSINPEILKTVTRTYVAVDKWGNKSEPCTFTFDVLRPDEDIIKGPANYFNTDGNAFDCGYFEYDHYGNPIIDPTITGVPYFDLDDDNVFDPETGDIALYPEPEQYCNVLATYSDLTLEVDCVVKVVRTWTIIEWNCDPRTFDPITQMIEIKDNTAPSIDAHHDLTLSTNIPMDYYHPQHGQIYCGANINLPAAYVNDDCYDDVDVSINIEDVYGNPVDFVDGNGGYAQVPRGHFLAIYEAKDACYNSTKDTIHLWVQDLTPPVPVCDNNTVVSLNSQDGTHVYASTFDEGSYDDCQLSRIVSRRMPDEGGYVNPEDCDCPVGLYGFHYLGRYNGKDYYISKHEYTADKAKSEASALEGHVFSYNTAEERDWVYDAVYHHSGYQEECFWIGVKRDYGDDYVWHDGTDFPAGEDSPMWAPGEPVPGLGECTYACYDGSEYTGTWYNGPCMDDLNDFRYKYVLEMPVCGFADAVSFCCDDAGDNMVILRAIDAECNFNDCMVSVEVQDKTAPAIICPADMTVDCEETYDMSDLGASFGYAYVSGTCGDTLVETVVEELDQCQEGKIIRTFTATSSGGTSSSCSQTIYFNNDELFYFNCNKPDDPNDHVIWPLDITMNGGCDDPTSSDYHPDVTGYPHFIGDNQCHLVGANWEDEIFEFNPSNDNNASCFKILRRWSVIDWCDYDPYDGQYYTCTYEQVIKLNNNDDPYFVDGEGNPIECLEDKEPVCTYDVECEEGFVELVAMAFDSCSQENLTWQYEIFLNYDEHYGSFDYDYKETGNGNVANASVDASGDAIYYPIGTHLVRWTFFDRCGNTTTCDQEFSIVNCIQPTAYCLNSLAVSLGIHEENGDTTGYVELWASDFDAGSFHQCGYQVVGHFIADSLEATNIVFDCEDALSDTTMVTVYFTAVDYHGDPIVNELGELLQTFCTVGVDVQDNQGACGDTGMRVGIGGSIMDENEAEISDVMVDLLGAAGLIEMTDEFGDYAFPEMPLGNSYDIDPHKNDDYLNGVSTLDIVMIQRHVLGLNEIESPYKIIAADINNDQTITAIDVIELRKMILGIYSEFPANESWRFIDKQYNFYDDNPLDEAFPEIYEIPSLQDEMVIDFIGVKIGDVNNSAILNFNGPSVDTRSNSTLDLSYDLITDQNTTTIDVYADQLIDLYGMQFTLQLDGDVVNVISGSIDVNDQNIALISNDMMTFSWNSSQLIGVDTDSPLFSIVVEDLSSDINMNSAITKKEAYSADFTAMDIELTYRSGDRFQFDLAQNVPNPFSDFTTVEFSIPAELEVEFMVYDVAGKVVMQENGIYPAGKHTIRVDAEGISGINYYTIKAGKFTATKKMVVIK